MERATGEPAVERRRGRPRVIVCTAIIAAAIAIIASTPGGAAAHAAAAAAVQASSATITGTVFDETGVVVPDVAVSVVNLGTGLQRQTTAGRDGAFVLPLLPPGRYSLTAERDGFATARIPDVVLNVNDEIALRVQLKVASVDEAVTVSGASSRVRVASSIATVVDRRFVENMPLNGRSLQSLISLTPGVVAVPSSNGFSGEFSVNGQRPSSNYFIVDGVSGNVANGMGFVNGVPNTGALPALSTTGSTAPLVSLDALEEFQVQTSTYAAEYGRMPGGQISMVTRSGTNELHGTLFEYLRNEKFDANDWFANRAGQPKPPLRQNQFGGVLGGPVRLPMFDGRDKAFFFLSYEGLRLRTPSFLLSNVPTQALRDQAPEALRPILDSWPLPNGRDLGNGLAEYAASFSNGHRMNATSVRLDYNAWSKMTLFGRYNHAPSHSLTRRNSNLANPIFTDLTPKTLTIGSTWLVGSSVTNDLRVNYTPNGGGFGELLDDFGGAVPYDRALLVSPQFVRDGGGFNSAVFLSFTGLTATSGPISSLNFSASTQSQVNIVDTIGWIHGGHHLKAGIDYRTLRPRLAPREYLIYPSFPTAANVIAGVAPTATINNTGKETFPIYTNLSLFVQDAWTLNSRVTLNTGVRWEYNPPPSERDGLLPYGVTGLDDLRTMTLAPAGTPLWETRYNSFAPRLGATVLLVDRPGAETVLRTGAGLFYDMGSGQSSAGYRGVGFSAQYPVTNLAFPIDSSRVAPAVPSIQPPYPDVYAFDADLTLPYTWHWNASVEQSLGTKQRVTLSYVAAVGRDLLVQRVRNVAAINPSFTRLLLTTNEGTSDYKSLQAQFQRQLSGGLQALVSYTWSHAQDVASSDRGTGTEVLLYGDADFDIRHNLAIALTYDLPSLWAGSRAAAPLHHWSLDTRITTRSALPLNVIAGTYVDPVDGTQQSIRPLVVSGVPFYLDDPTAPGGRRINRAAFTAPPTGQQGDLPRNVLRGFGVWQVDLALRRRFRIAGPLKLELRAEAFNLFNSASFGAIANNITNANFGEATNMLGRQLGGLNALYQVGGPRSMQFAVRLQF